MRSKEVGYSYATSPNADRYNGGKACWLVSVADYPDGSNHVVTAVCDDEQTAISIASEIKLPWNPVYLRFAPDNVKQAS